MDVETLERSMSELNQIELEYKDGTRSDWFFPRECIVDQDGHLRIKRNIFLDFTGGSGIGRGRKPMTHDQLLFVFRTLRYEPAPEHAHDYVELAYVYRGSCRQRVNGSELELLQGQVLFLDSDCPHFVYPLGKDDILISVCVERHFLESSLDTLRLSGDWLTAFLMGALDEQTGNRRYVLFHSEGNRRIKLLFQELMCEYIDPSPNMGRMMAGLLQLLLVDLLNVFECDVDRTVRESYGRRVSAVPIIGYIQENYLECTLESVAEHFYVSPNYISRILKKSIGKTYSQLVQELRISHAASLIRVAGCTANEAACAVGYTNMSFFYRKFKEAYGMTPAEYRVVVD